MLARVRSSSSTAGLLCTAGTLIALLALHLAPAVARSHCTATAAACRAAAATRRDGAPPSIKTYTYHWGPIRTGDFATRWINVKAPHPKVNGFVVGLHARLVDRATGQPISIARAMLHHLFFRHLPSGRQQPTCAGRGSVFYSTGEEDETLRFPPGYGYRLRPSDRWRLFAMIMSHSRVADEVTIEYTVTVDSDRHLVPVQPFWLRANGCHGHLSYPVAGGGPRGARDVRTFAWTVPFTGRIVAASGHLHGGALKMWLTEPRCHNRRLLDTDPRYAMPGDLMYHLHPVLHEPGPTDTRMFLSRTGIAVRRGETLDLRAAYDDHRPHWAVMAVMHLYLARARTAPHGCRPLPRDRRELAKPGPARTVPPVVHIPLTRLDSRGAPQTIHGALGPARRRASGVVVTVSGGDFSIPHLAVPRGAAVTWRFPEPILHDATFAGGPRAVGALATEDGGSVSVRFPVPGRYRFFCSLHPMTMHEVVDVGGT